MNNINKVIQVFDSCSKEYEKKYMGISLYMPSIDLFCASIKKDRANIFELGCGPGNITRYLAEQHPHYSIVSTDISSNMLKLARKNVPSVSFVEMDSRTISNLNGTFDGIMCGFVLPYLKKEEAIQLMYLTKHSSLESRQIIGSGTLLDTSRFRHLISKRINVDPRNVHTYIIGEHGAGSIPVWSNAQIGALHLDDFAEQSNITFGPDEKKQIFEDVLSAGKEVIKRKGATFYGIAQTVLRILTAILRDEKSLLTVSTKVQGYADINGLTLSLPVILGRRGVEKSPVPRLNREEKDGFQKAAESLKATALDVGIL